MGKTSIYEYIIFFLFILGKTPYPIYSKIELFTVFFGLSYIITMLRCARNFHFKLSATDEFHNWYASMESF